jgi:altronate hydrolase
MTVSNLNFMPASPPGVVPLHEVAIRLHPQDDVAIGKLALQVGTILDMGGDQRIPVRQFIPSGHKIALRDLAPGQAMRRYGQIIGFTTQSVTSGEHVHTHNLAVQDFDREYVFGVEASPVAYVPESQRRTFLGYGRASGRAGTRNYIAVIATVNCSAHTIREIAHYFTPERLAGYPNVDGVIALAHVSGCATRVGGADQTLLQRVLAGMARHPNVGAYVLVGLGCESNQITELVENHHLDTNGSLPPSLTIQESGGIRKTVQAGIEAVQSLLPAVNSVSRTPQRVSELALALQCGGSDSWSGVTANPVVGLVADEIVRQGGTAVLSETPEIYGAEHLLMRSAPKSGRSSWLRCVGGSSIPRAWASRLTTTPASATRLAG